MAFLNKELFSKESQESKRHKRLIDVVKKREIIRSAEAVRFCGTSVAINTYSEQTALSYEDSMLDKHSDLADHIGKIATTEMPEEN